MKMEDDMGNITSVKPADHVTGRAESLMIERIILVCVHTSFQQFIMFPSLATGVEMNP